MKKISIKKIINISFGFTLLFFAYSCNNEDDVCISEKSETRFDIPQGNHDFDEQIVAWSKDYDINVLYKFTLPDLNYNFTASKELNYKITQWADEEGIRAAVRFLKEDFIDLYPDSIKKTLLPSKILLAGMLYPEDKYEPLLDTIAYSQNCKLGIIIQGLDHITLPRVDKEFVSRISIPTYRKRMKLAVNRTFINFLLFPTDENIAQLPSTDIINTFCSSSQVHTSHPNITSPYSYENSWTNPEDTYKLGFLEGNYNSYSKKYTPFSENEDLTCYIDFIFTQSKSELETNPIYTKYPLVKEKCDYLIKTFAQYGIDLHSIGEK